MIDDPYLMFMVCCCCGDGLVEVGGIEYDM